MSKPDPTTFTGEALEEWLSALQLAIAGSGENGLEWAGRLGHECLDRALKMIGVQPNSHEGRAWHDLLEDVATSWDHLYEQHTSSTLN